MIIKTAIVFWFLFLCVHCQAQTTGDPRRSVSNADEKSSGLLRQNTANSSSSKESFLSEKDFLDVLIATNEDCLFLLNNEAKGLASKNAFLYLKLAPGTYRYTAKSQATGDVHSDTFSVSRLRLNEVFIDMLYVIDVESEKRASLGSKAVTATNASHPNNITPQGEKSNAAGNPAMEKELAAIHTLMANMVPIKEGSFVMGNNRSPSADEAEHRVMLNAFLMGKYEVTQEQWEMLMGYNPSLNRGCPSCPVENVSWEEVMKFIRKVNSLTNRKFRLPTEAEWEYVARVGGREEIEKAGGAEEYIKNAAWAFINSNSKTHPVGKKLPNAAGVYDLFGNVSEWCMDWYGAFFYKEDYTEKNPEGPPLGKEKVVRGGNYKDYVGDRFRPSFRNKMNPKSKGSEIGFRLVMEGQ